MADYTLPENVDRRLRFFDGQFLREQDFIDEQLYHLDRGHRAGRLLRTPGVLEGLAVDPVPNASRVQVGTGTAIDGLGRLIVRADAGDPLDLAHLVDTADPVAVLVVICYAEQESDAETGSASPRWREVPAVAAFLEGDQDLPPADTHIRLARLTLAPDGSVTPDPAFPGQPSGATVRGGLSVSGTSITGVPTQDPGGAATQLRIRSSMQLVGDNGSDGTTRLDVTNGAHDYGRTNLVLTGRFQDGNDEWRFGSMGRTALVFARNSASSGENVGAVGDELHSVQLEGRTGSLGFLTQARGVNPALVIRQDGAVGVGTPDPTATVDIVGSLAVRGVAAVHGLGRWTAQMSGIILVITIAPGSYRNRIVIKPRARGIGPFRINLPDGEVPQNWFGEYTCVDVNRTVIGPRLPLTQAQPMTGDGGQVNLAGGGPDVLIVDLDRITLVATAAG
jgi:hypothetical protein